MTPNSEGLGKGSAISIYFEMLRLGWVVRSPDHGGIAVC